MPKVVSPQALDRIAELVARYPDGVGVGALSQALDVPRRTAPYNVGYLPLSRKNEVLRTAKGARLNIDLRQSLALRVASKILQ